MKHEENILEIKTVREIVVEEVRLTHNYLDSSHPYSNTKFISFSSLMKYLDKRMFTEHHDFKHMALSDLKDDLVKIMKAQGINKEI